MYHFLSGYTAKVAGTEKGVTEPEATFSTCFGAPFMPRHPSVYGNLLRDLIAKHHVDCWLVNTGWTGGKYGAGRRMPIRVTRRLLTAALDGSLQRADFRTRSVFRLRGADLGAGRRAAHPLPGQDLAGQGGLRRRRRSGWSTMFRENFKRFEDHVDADVRAAAPQMSIAADDNRDHADPGAAAGFRPTSADAVPPTSLIASGRISWSPRSR